MSWIQTISKTVNAAFSVVRPALPAIPPILLLCEILNRPGLSAIALATAVIQRLPEAGIPTGTNPDGSPSKVDQFVRIFSEEIVKEIKNNMKVTVAGAPGTMMTVVTGQCPVGPVTGTSTNVMPFSVDGIAQ